ncbi:isoprenylcysteine carboxylmethyltransferase family protein [Caldithrix abyssi]|nr:isoprenylcysteine carboxylmethyltransferase family protein [Caldithrix abyssi]
MDIRNFFFKYRSYTPIPIGIMIVYFARVENAYLLIGIPLLLIGELIRIWAVSYAGGETRARNVGATALCSSGPYAFVRNPLYLGNMLMYLGIVMSAGAANVWLMAATTFAFFFIQYSLIISLEEETLGKQFGSDYDEYKKNVPAIFPHFSRWNSSDNKEPAGIIKTLRREKRTLQNVAFFFILITLRTQFFD